MNLLAEKQTGFVNFANILTAVQVVEDLQDNPDYVNARVGFGKDRCAQPAQPKTNKPVKGGGKDRAKQLK